MTENIDFFNSAYGATLEKDFFIPDGCGFVVVGSRANGTTLTTIITESPHCLRNGNTVRLQLSHVGETCNVITYEEIFVIENIATNTFDIPYNSNTCDRGLVGKGHKPLNLGGSNFTGEIVASALDYFGGDGGSVAAGDKTVEIESDLDSFKKIKKGGSFTIGTHTSAIVGASGAGRVNNCNETYFVILETASPVAYSGVRWSASTPNGTSPGLKIDDLTLVATNPDGRITMGYDTTQTDFDQTYFYRIFEARGGVTTTRFHGRITYGFLSSATDVITI